MSWPPRTARDTSEIVPERSPAATVPPTNGVDPKGSFDHAWCSVCDWHGPGRRARASARTDLDHHLQGCQHG